MSTCRSRALRLFYAFSGALLLSAGLAHPVVAQTEQMTPEEQAAVQLVQDWFAAWNSKDTSKVASYLAPNVVFRSYTNSPICHGPGPILTRYKFIMSLGAVISDVKAFAVADRIAGRPTPKGWGVDVLSSRIDMVRFNGGKPVALTASGFFIINQGKIQEFWEEPAQPAARRGPPPTCAGGL
ncbi:MAG: nuclear transport factor 2 family protein [Steroidobacteraceae bacterium]